MEGEEVEMDGEVVEGMSGTGGGAVVVVVVDWLGFGSERGAFSGTKVGFGVVVVDEEEEGCASSSSLSLLDVAAAAAAAAVSNKTSPLPCGGSANTAGSRCSAPYPNTHPNAPSPPQPRLGVMLTKRVTSYS